MDIAQLLPPDSWMGHALRLPLRMVPKGRMVTIPFGAARGGRWEVGVGLHGCWLGTYEWSKQRLFAREAKPGMVVYDIGAGVGFYTLLAARQTGPRGWVFAFEPNPANVHQLRGVMLNNRAANIEVLPCAVADVRSTRQFDPVSSFTGRLSVSGHLTVEVEAIDNLRAEGRIPPADLVAIDVEGAELEVLAGAAGFFTAHAPVIFLATHSEELQRGCLRFLGQLGYRAEPIDGARDLESSRQLVLRKKRKA